MKFTDRIEINPYVMHSKPVIKGTRVPVSLVLGYLAGGMTIEEILAEHPTITREDVLACLAYASQVVAEEEVLELALAG